MRRVSGNIAVLRPLGAALEGSRGGFCEALPVNTVVVMRHMYVRCLHWCSSAPTPRSRNTAAEAQHVRRP
jgi:hypothetical protein